MKNRWGQDIKRGVRVMVQPVNGTRYYAGAVKYIVPADAFSRAYGRQVMLDGYSVGIDDCSIATPQAIFRARLLSVQMNSDCRDLVLMRAALRTPHEYAARAIDLAFMGMSAADTNRALFPHDHA